MFKLPLTEETKIMLKYFLKSKLLKTLIDLRTWKLQEWTE